MLRLLLPPEGSVSGETLFLSQCWLGLAAVWWYLKGVRNDRPLNWNWFDTLTWAVIGGHGLSTLRVILSGGDQRAAVNLFWEWVALGAMVFLFRRLLTSSAEIQRFLLSLLLMVTTLAGLGWYQHFLWYPSVSREYQQMREELDELQAQKDILTPGQAKRINELELSLIQQGVPLEGRERILWEQRLYNSREPFGPFALANTFAGLLLVGVFLALGTILNVWAQRTAWKRWLVPALAIVLIGGCLLLTKSRTAWVGLTCGLMIFVFLSSRFSSLLNRQRVIWGLGVVAVLVLIVGGFMLSGGLDQQVLTEAPRSLMFRLQYWQGTASVLRHYPILGTGPGNFRDHYLRFKLPESSEEIADPHNIVLDLWTSGGLLALAAFLGLLGKSLFSGWRSSPREPAPESGFAPREVFRDPILLGTLGSLALLFLWAFALGGAVGQTGLLLIALGVLVMLSGNLASVHFATPLLVAALFGLLVHLLGAGGIEMPGITQIVLVVMLWIAEGHTANPSATPVVKISQAERWIPLAVSSAAFLGCFFTATSPVMNRNTWIEEGDYLLMTRGDVIQAKRSYENATAADSLSVIPLERQASLALRQWRAQPGNDSLFGQFLKASGMHIDRNPIGYQGFQLQGEGLLARARITNNPQDALQAAAALEQAVERYPTSSELHLALFEAWRLGEKPKQAASHAETALKLDELNHREGHSDKYLPEDQVRELREFLSE